MLLCMLKRVSFIWKSCFSGYNTSRELCIQFESFHCHWTSIGFTNISGSHPLLTIWSRPITPHNGRCHSAIHPNVRIPPSGICCHHKWIWHNGKNHVLTDTVGTQDGRNFPDDIFIYIFLNENVWISIEMSLKFVFRVQLSIFQHWFRQWPAVGQTTSHYLNQWWLVYWRTYA